MTALVFAALFALYLASSYPALAPRDAADLASAALTLGVAHPPGYPLYGCLGKLWMLLLPLGDPAWRLNLLSAAAGAGAGALAGEVIADEALGGALIGGALGAGIGAITNCQQLGSCDSPLD